MKRSNMTHRLLERFHRDQNGAVALVMLAAFLALFMMGMVIYDANMSVADKLDVQAAADSASWSQSTIEARTMNMVAFTNVGKRVTVGFTSMYQAAIWANVAVIAQLAIALAACLVANAICPGCCGCLTSLCNYLRNLLEAAIDILDEESDDWDKFNGQSIGVANEELMKDFFGADIKALNNYQDYMIDITPWWSWAEGTLRGVQNGATITASFPAPDTLAGGIFDSLTSLAGQSGVEDKLPLEPGSYDSGTCDDGARSGVPDRLTHGGEFTLRSFATVSGQYETIVMGMIDVQAIGLYGTACGSLESVYGNEGAPIEVSGMGSEARYNMFTSNLALAYYADKRMSDDSGDQRSKLGFVEHDYNAANPMHKAPGYWAFARSEISYRGDQGSGEWKWNPRWTTRMRPVALPGEWEALEDDSGNDIQMQHAWRDLGPMLVATGTVLNFANLSNGEIDVGGDLINDVARMDSAASAMGEDNNIEGAPK
jgi:hypothetical protein